MYATVRPRSYLCRTQNIALQVPTSQLNAQRNMESLTASFITWIVEPSSALKNIISQLGAAQSLNFAGPRESEHLGAYDLCLVILIEALASHCGKNSDPKPTN